jgi:hypothetical protein
VVQYVPSLSKAESLAPKRRGNSKTFCNLIDYLQKPTANILAFTGKILKAFL